MQCVLLVDNSPSSAPVVHNALENSDAEVLFANSAAEALDLIVRRHPDIVLMDAALPDQPAMASFEQIQRLDPGLPVVFIAASGTSRTTIEAMKKGALDYLLKPLDSFRVRQVVEHAFVIRHWMRRPTRVAESTESGPTGTDLLIGQCPAMQEVYKAIGRVAQQDIPVLIRGESGTGKELVARAIYEHSPRSRGRFLAVNCAAIPETLLESELFGHEKGAFTGAAARRIGKFEQCDGGVLFLDEIGDMTALMQSKVLRVLQDKRFERVGSNETITSDVWIITATNRDLDAMVANGQFRADLYYRLNGFPLPLPPLRERGSDIPLLVKHFVSLFNRELGKTICEVSPKAMQRLAAHSWPGNVRELQSVLRRAVVQATGPVLLPEFLSLETKAFEAPQIRQPAGCGPLHPLDAFIDRELDRGTQSLHADTIALVERTLLARVLQDAGGNQSRAARILGITRGSLRHKIREHGIAISPSVCIEDTVGPSIPA